jgi:CYTH domain-containing protein
MLKSDFTQIEKQLKQFYTKTKPEVRFRQIIFSEEIILPYLGEIKLGKNLILTKNKDKIIIKPCFTKKTIKDKGLIIRKEKEFLVERGKFKLKIKNKIGEVIEKKRTDYEFKDELGEVSVDIFTNKGYKDNQLVILEKEFESLKASEEFNETVYDFIIKEVTEDRKYKNFNLATALIFNNIAK